MSGTSVRFVRRAALVACLALAACELREVTLTEPERAVVVEAYVRIAGESPFGPVASNGASVLLHEALGIEGGSGPVPGAEIVITRASDGLRLFLTESQLGNCAITIPIRGSGTCYQALSQTLLERLEPGDRLALRVELANGGVLESETVVPGAFSLRNVSSGDVCALPPGQQSGIVWSHSSGAWAYISDTFVTGLGPIFGTAVVDDPLYLWGLSVSASDTTIAFPGEFGLFARAEIDHEVTTALQQGLPLGVSAVVTVAAVDRNWVNWARGGNFNPSGLVRVPSVRGDGTGVFAAGVLHTFRVVAGEPGPQMTTCPPAVEDGSAGD
jgi:hypothetical protein